MGVVKCVVCKKYIDESEAVMVPVDDTHDAAYCVNCAPDEDMTFDEDYDDE
mgnify:CR=1 FL=1